ncbi:unnamed protein product [Arabis nemorensis]|uniref:SURP motif domain-containing protein n=1 Tax=Arabis nemorensis TaxID=586526 RepID=A0A565APE1_9BRAS|nr:unnamed protein product [Arabis nemorensis]
MATDSDIPPPHIRANILRTAYYVTTNGLEAERVTMEFFAYDESFGFLSNSHPYHAYYKRELARAQAEPELANPPKLGLPNGMTLEKFNTMKLTAQFIAWYGNDYVEAMIDWHASMEKDFANKEDINNL